MNLIARSTPWLALLFTAITGPFNSASAFDDKTAQMPSVPTAGSVRYVASSRIMLSYEIAPESPPVTGVELWYTKDHGKTWQTSVAEPQATDGPLAFNADQDGLYGFCIVLRNQAGASSPPPSSGTAPQYWVRVDRSAPAVQALAVRPDPRFDVNREIHLRWSATDDDLPDRPVALHYRTEQTKTFLLIAESLSARSAYKWVVPTDVSGRLEIKISATDRAGNTGVYLAEPIRVETSKSQDVKMSKPVPMNDSRVEGNDSAKPQLGEAAPKNARPDGPRVDLTTLRADNDGEPDAGLAANATESSKEARRKYDLGTWHRLRGEYAEASTRFTEALSLDPKLLAARCDLGGVLLLRGDTSAAERELQNVLTVDPSYRPALKGLALIQAKRRNYQSARETLDKVLLLDPGDADAWLAFGDVMMFTGDRSAARRAWTKAAALGEKSDVRARAEKRLELYPSA